MFTELCKLKIMNKLFSKNGEIKNANIYFSIFEN